MLKDLAIDCYDDDDEKRLMFGLPDVCVYEPIIKLMLNKYFVIKLIINYARGGEIRLGHYSPVETFLN